jgi:hypothetical protein
VRNSGNHGFPLANFEIVDVDGAQPGAGDSTMVEVEPAG